MNPVYLWASQRTRLQTGLDASILSQPLFRRMTALQKAVVLCYTQLSEAFPEAHALVLQAQAPLFLCSTYGELGPMLRVTKSIVDHDLPISPKDFQHSVLNAALSYLTMSQDWHQPGYALSGGFAGPDSTVYMAAKRIALGLDRANVIVHAHENFANAVEAEAEVLILGHQPPPAGGFRLERISWTRRELADTWAEAPFRFYSEAQHDEYVPWLTEAEGPVTKRFVSSRGEQGWVTVWNKC